MPDLGYQGTPNPGEPEHPIKIAQITFAYHNAQVIDWLKQRGALIVAEKHEKVDELNQKIVDAIEKPDGKLLNELQHPCSVFATFECEEGQKRALEYTDAVAGRMKDPKYDHMRECYKDFLGEEIDIQAACEPTDIIWENRSAKCRSLKKFIVVLIITLMLCGSAGLIFYLQTTSLSLKMKYPVHPCSEEYELYAKDDGINLEQFEKDAINEFERNYEANKARLRTYYTGTYQCFCTYQKIHNPDTYDVPNHLHEPIDGQEEMSICAFYDSDKSTSTMLGHAITAVIIVVNTILRMVIIKLIIWIKEDTYSAQLSLITNGVFLAQFFNTGFLLTLVNANMSEHN